jgi:DtxR family Mn-dependent transcriptional regulator
MPQTKLPESQSVQDFLKAVYTLQEDCERVSTNALADVLSISAPSVTDMVSRLSDVGLIDYRKYHGARLTEAGKQAAEQIIQRHKLIEEYLVSYLGFAADEAHQEAEQMEHAVSERFVNALIHMLNNQKFAFCNVPIEEEAIMLLPKGEK